MADSKLAVPRAESTSPPPHCAICLGTCKNKCRANSCMHEFCYSCLLEWSRIKAECPLCKQEFKTILHNIKSINEYDVHIVETPLEHNRFLENASLIYLPPATPPLHHHYQFRTTLTVDSHGEHAIQQMLLHHPLLIGSYNPERYYHRRHRGDTSTAFRRSVYADNLWVYAPPDITGRYRDVSPSYYRNNPAARTRLVPWLNRELNALLHENTQHVMNLVDTILDHLLRHHICSYMFRSLLYDSLSNKTDHFIHEFYNFMRSPFDMVGYDRHVIYTERHQHSPVHFIDELDISDYDSDVILISDGNNNQGGAPAEPVVIDLLETDSDEPIIVSEERAEQNHVLDIANEAEDEEENRKPILPIKLRIKNKHKKEKKSRGKKKRRHPSTSSRSGEGSSSESSSSESEYKRYKQKRLLKKVKKEKRRRLYDDEDDSNIPLASFVKRKKVRRHKKRDGETDSSSGDESLHSDHKYSRGCGKSRGEDKHNAGPSSGRLKHMLKKEATTNQWYSRPLVFDSDSSEN